jgi:ABC-2 type transport system permease protein
VARTLRTIFHIMVKDLRVYYFKPPNLIMGLMFPVVMVLAMAMRNPGQPEWLAPGLVALTILFGTSTIEVVLIMWERQMQTFERLLLAPIPLGGLVAAKVAGGAVFGLFITAAVAVFSFTILGASVANPPLLLAAILASTWCFSTFGTLFGTIGKDMVGASMTTSNYIRFPMIFLSGIFVPLASMPLVFQVLAYFVPLTYSVSLLRAAYLGQVSDLPPAVSLAALFVFGLVFLLWSIRNLARERA